MLVKRFNGTRDYFIPPLILFRRHTTTRSCFAIPTSASLSLNCWRSFNPLFGRFHKVTCIIVQWGHNKVKMFPENIGFKMAPNPQGVIKIGFNFIRINNHWLDPCGKFILMGKLHRQGSRRCI